MKLTGSIKVMVLIIQNDPIKYDMEIRAETTDLSTDNISTDTSVNGEKKQTVSSCNYLGTNVGINGGSNLVALVRVGQTTASLVRRKPILNDNKYLSAQR